MRRIALFLAFFTFVFLSSSTLKIEQAFSADENRPDYLARNQVYNPLDTEEYLRQFHEDPKRVMNTQLAPYDANTGEIITESNSPFADAGISREEMHQARLEVRRKICVASGREDCDEDAPSKSAKQNTGNNTGNSTWAAINEHNEIQRFLFTPAFVKNLKEMEEKGFQEAVLPVLPWSDSYWPTAKGGLGRRWLDSSFPGNKRGTKWIDSYTHFQTFAPGYQGLNAMSPAEKYDYLVGDYNYVLTNAMWGWGKRYFDEQREVPSWTGLCHGWAAASSIMPNPKKSVVLTATDGQPITFYPSDIKALAALAWGESPPRFGQVGRRCNDHSPDEDEYGRVKDDNCFDVNPGTWHMAAVNQIAVEKRSFVFDSMFNYQVWNFPVYGYRYQYFNPQTLATTPTMAGATVRIGDFTKDKFKTYRSPETKYVVGVVMEMHYVTVSGASTRAAGSIKESFKYVYDLELNASGEILGGEWYTNFHPDFLWNLPPDAKPKSSGETADFVWDGLGPVPAQALEAAPTSSRDGEVVWPVVDALLRRSVEP